jgi:acyl transferase domain-containing protein
MLTASIVPCALSGDSELVLSERARTLATRMTGDPELQPHVIGRDLAREPALAHRAVVLAADREELLGGLSVLGGTRTDETLADVVRQGKAVPGGTVFVFPGQGSQWPGMALELTAQSPSFGDCLEEISADLETYAGWNLMDVLSGAPGAPGLDRSDVVQPALFAVMVSLAALWESFSVRPNAVIGHSQGEIAAAYVAGALSLTDAVRIVVTRGRVLRRLVGSGGMLSVPMPSDWVARYVATRTDRLAVAAENGPGSVVVSGDVPTLEELMDRCAQEGVRARLVKVDYPSHSPQIEQVREEFVAGVGQVAVRTARVPYYSSVLGGLARPDALTADYWYRNLRQTVRFEAAVRAATADGNFRFIEVSPHPVVGHGMRLTLRDTPGAVVLETVRRGEGGIDKFVRSAAEAHVCGADVTWPGCLFSPGQEPTAACGSLLIPDPGRA